MPPAVRVLNAATDKLRPLGNHPALSAVLRRTAREWVCRWAQSTPPAAATSDLASAPSNQPRSHDPARAQSLNAQNVHAHDAIPSDEHGDTTAPTFLSASASSSVACLENAAACLTEARAVLSALAAAAEPTAGVLSSCPAGAREEQAKPAGDSSGENDDGGAAAASGKKAGKGKGAAQKGSVKKTAAGAAGAAAGAVPGGLEGGTAAGEGAVGTAACAAVSTPLGRSLVMVQLEEACVRTMLGRAKGEGRSSKKAKEAAANAEGVTPVQR